MKVANKSNKCHFSCYIAHLCFTTHLPAVSVPAATRKLRAAAPPCWKKSKASQQARAGRCFNESAVELSDGRQYCITEYCWEHRWFYARLAVFKDAMHSVKNSLIGPKLVLSVNISRFSFLLTLNFVFQGLVVFRKSWWISKNLVIKFWKVNWFLFCWVFIWIL